MVNSEDKGCGKPLYENNLTMTPPFRLEMTKVMESISKKSTKSKVPRERERLQLTASTKNP